MTIPPTTAVPPLGVFAPVGTRLFNEVLVTDRTRVTVACTCPPPGGAS